MGKHILYTLLLASMSSFLVACNSGTNSAATSMSSSSSSGVSRDPLQQPFASTSIWNMPIGSSAVFAPANLAANPDSSGSIWGGISQADPERIILTPTAPLTTINYSSAGWSTTSRCAATSGSGIGLPVRVPIPADYVLPSDRNNDGAAIMLADGRTIAQMQPLAVCTAGGPGTALEAPSYMVVDLYGDGIPGAHGGSFLSTLGGTIRVGELRPGQQGMHHALKVDVNSAWELYHAPSLAQAYRWPALTADGTWSTYGTISGPNNNNPAMKMGALLAIPSSINIDSLGLESEPGRELAWTLQNYGAYIVDTSGSAPGGFNICEEEGPRGSVQAQFQSDYGYPFTQWVTSNTPWSRDIARLRVVLQVVNNNSLTSIGGGGTPRQPLAPALSPP